MTIKRVKLSEALKRKGKSKEKSLNKLTKEEIHQRALSDPDNPPLTEEELKEFKPAAHID